MIASKLFELRDRAEALRRGIMRVTEGEPATSRSQLQADTDALSEALRASEVPEYFRVAVVGQFKTGKSSFVNRLADERLAGVETNPETAAISVFRYSEEPRGEVRLI